MAILGFVTADFAIADSLPLPDPNKVGRAGVFVMVVGGTASLWITANASLTTYAWSEISLAAGNVPITGLLATLPNPNTTPQGQVFYATDTTFSAIVQPRPDAPTTTKWWQPIANDEVLRNDAVAGVGGVAINTFGTLSAGVLQTPGAIGEDCNSVSYSTAIAGAQILCASLGVARVKAGLTSFQFGDTLMTDATGLALSWDANPAHHQIAMALQSTLPGELAFVALLRVF